MTVVARGVDTAVGRKVLKPNYYGPDGQLDDIIYTYTPLLQ